MNIAAQRFGRTATAEEESAVLSALVMEAKMITAQDLYDRRDERGEIDGNELHTLFAAVCGDESPSGRTPIDPAALRAYAAEIRAAAQDPIGGLAAIAAFAESFTR